MTKVETSRAMMTTAQAARYWGFNTASAFRKRVKKLLPPEFIHRRGNQLYFDPKELDMCTTRLSELPPGEAARARKCDLRFRRSEIDAWMLSVRLEFQAKVHQVLYCTSHRFLLWL